MNCYICGKDVSGEFHGIWDDQDKYPIEDGHLTDHSLMEMDVKHYCHGCEPLHLLTAKAANQVNQ